MHPGRPNRADVGYFFDFFLDFFLSLSFLALFFAMGCTSFGTCGSTPQVNPLLTSCNHTFT